LSTKVHLLADEAGLPMACRITAGQAAENAQAISLLEGQPAETVIADKGDDSTQIEQSDRKLARQLLACSPFQPDFPLEP
jgi:transposase